MAVGSASGERICAEALRAAGTSPERSAASISMSEFSRSLGITALSRRAVRTASRQSSCLA